MFQSSIVIAGLMLQDKPHSSGGFNNQAGHAIMLAGPALSSIEKLAKHLASIVADCAVEAESLMLHARAN